MKLYSNNTFRILIVVVVVLVVIIISTTATPQVSNSVTVGTAALGFLVIVYQLIKDHKIKKAEFIYNLNTTFNSDTEIAYIYMKLKKLRDKKKDNTEEDDDEDDKKLKFTVKDGRRMGNYIMFFIIMNHLIDDKLVDIKMVDSIFCNKFFLFCNNEYSYKYQLQEKEFNYPVLKLYEKWYNFRVLKKIKELYPDFSLSDQDNLYEKFDDGTIKYKPE